MLISLHVKNLALIDETEVFFGKGLNILSGETGAGKSIIIGSINLALGGRADKDLIRHGAEYGLVELVFQVDTLEQEKQIRSLDIPIEEDGTIIIQRKIMPTRNSCKIGGELAPTKLLKELATLFIDIHGQHEHQSLLYKKNHHKILDSFAGEELTKTVKAIKDSYNSYVSLKEELESTLIDDDTRRKEIAFAEFEVNEISEISLRVGEDEQQELTTRTHNRTRTRIHAGCYSQHIHGIYTHKQQQQHFLVLPPQYENHDKAINNNNNTKLDTVFT